MANPKPETKLLQKIVEHIRAGGGDAFHLSGSLKQRGGEPDLCGEYPRGGWLKPHHLKLEVKTPSNAPVARQLYRLRYYHRMGYVAGVVTSTEDFDRLIEAYETEDFSNLPFYHIYAE